MTMISTHVEQKAFVSIADAIREEGMEKGIEKGMKKAAGAIARNLLLKGLDLDLVSDSTGLAIEIVKKIKTPV